MKGQRPGLWVTLPILWVAWALGVWRLNDLSMWIDEWFTVNIVHTPWASFLEHIVATERRPPLHYALLKAWAFFAGDHEFTLRFYSITLALLGVATLYALGRHLLGRSAGWVAALLLASSPFAVLYGRMIRAYTQTMFLGTLSTLLLLRALEKPSGERWLAYGGTAISLLYTDYSGLAVVGSHVLFALVSPMARSLWRRWLIVFTGIALAYGFWGPVMMAQKSHPVRLTDLATGGIGLALKLIYPFYSWGAGETIFPWHPAALPSVVGCSTLLLFGLINLFRKDRTSFWLLTFLLVASLIFTAVLTTFVATDIPFINAASRSFPAAPIFYLGVAGGLMSLRIRWPQVWIAAAIGVGFVCALVNYYNGQQFHNPIYAVPIRQIVEEVRASCSPHDLIVAESDTLFGYYYRHKLGPAVYQDADYEVNRYYIQTHGPDRVWLITFGRDSTAGMGQAEELAAWLMEQYSGLEIRGYVTQDTTYQRVKEFLLRRPAYVHKVLIRIYHR